MQTWCYIVTESGRYGGYTDGGRGLAEQLLKLISHSFISCSHMACYLLFIAYFSQRLPMIRDLVKCSTVPTCPKNNVQSCDTLVASRKFPYLFRPHETALCRNVDSASATMVRRDAMRNDIACHQRAAGLSAIVPCHS